MPDPQWMDPAPLQQGADENHLVWRQCFDTFNDFTAFLRDVLEGDFKQARGTYGYACFGHPVPYARPQPPVPTG